MSITERQKDPQNIELLKAFVTQYDNAKLIRNPRIIITYIMALAIPTIIIKQPELKNIFAIIGAVWAVLALVCIYFEKDQVKIAAKLQDEFDTRVFKIDWNKILLGDHVSDETIHNLSSKFRGKPDMAWYGNLNSVNFPLDVLICQRNNVVWDWRLRLNYFKLNSVLLIALWVLGILIGLHYHMLLSDYIKIIFLPCAAALIIGYKELSEHFENYKAKKNLESKLNGLLDSIINRSEVADKTVLRQIQDLIYILRKCNAIIPSWFSSLHKKRYERRMQEIINKYYLKATIE